MLNSTDEEEEKILIEVRRATRQLVESLMTLSSSLDLEENGIKNEFQNAIAHARRERQNAAVVNSDRRAKEIRQAVSRANDAAGPLAGIVQSGDGLRIPRAIKIGELHSSAGSGIDEEFVLPFLLPLFDTGNIIIQSDSPEDGRSVAMSAVYEAVATTNPGLIKLNFIDPTLSGCWTPFGRLGEPGSDLAPRQAVESADIASMLTQLTSTVSDIAQLLQGRWGTLGEFLDEVGHEDPRPFQLMVVLDYPRGFDERNHSMLVRLAERGPQLGLNLIVHHDTNQIAPRGVNTSDLLSHCEQVTAGTYAGWPRVPKLFARYSDAPSVTSIHELCETLRSDVRASTSASVDLVSLLPTSENFGVESSANHLEVTIGKRGSEMVSFTLGDSTDNLHNVLVGGSVGSGKSNLLLTLIYGLVTRYSPDELELFLLDFKEGVEFAKFARDETFLPHARVVGIEADPELGKGVLEFLTEEFERRSELFKTMQVSNLKAYREATGHLLPRQLLIVDEFQVLLDGNHPAGRDNVGLLEVLARKGRAYGVHVILSSQTLSGIESLYGKSNSIFGQFPVRIALKSNPRESEVILGMGNVAASQLRFRGQAILNTNFGTVDSNRQVIVGYSSDQTIEAIDQTFASRRGFATPPKVFKAGELASPHPHFAALRRRRKVSGAVANLGDPLRPSSSALSFPMPPQSGRHLVIGGDGAKEAIGILHGATLSVALTVDTVVDFVIADATTGIVGEEFAATELCGALHRLGHNAVVVRTAEELESVVSSRKSGRVFLVGAAIDNLNLTPVKPFSSDSSNSLQAAIRDGHISGATLIGWWQRPKMVEDHLGNDWRTNVQGRILLKTDLRTAQFWTENLSMSRWAVDACRAVLVDVSKDNTTETFVPFKPLSLSRLTEFQK